MPFVLAALALRALIPAGFMPASSDSFAFIATICAPSSLESRSPATEWAELPASPDGHAQPHCDFCVSPPLGAPPVIDGARIPAVPASLAPASLVAQVASAAPDRAPSARAPPA
jgi:hypothetical protein